MRVASSSAVKIADEVWIATALLHRENPSAPDFGIDEIVARVAKENIAGTLRPGIYVHVVQHCVANRPPNPGRYRILTETRPGRRRLFRKGDSYHPKREGSKVTPNPSEIPSEYGGLLAWYHHWSSAALETLTESDPLLHLSGSGKDLWRNEHADDYVRRLRRGWE